MYGKREKQERSEMNEVWLIKTCVAMQVTVNYRQDTEELRRKRATLTVI